MAISRRTWLVGAFGAVFATPALAAPSATAALRTHPAFGIWSAPRKAGSVPMSADVTKLSGEIESLGQWLDGRASLLVFWATWCTPCLAETPELGRLQRKLEAAGANTAVRPVHAFDDATPIQARALLNKLGGANLDTVRASPTLEGEALRVFGQSPKEKGRTSLPALLLVKANGSIVGKMIGTPEPPPETGLLGEAVAAKPYWDDPATLDMLIKLGVLA